MQVINSMKTNIKITSHLEKTPSNEIKILIGVETFKKPKKEFKIIHETRNLKNQSKKLITTVYTDQII